MKRWILPFAIAACMILQLAGCAQTAPLGTPMETVANLFTYPTEEATESPTEAGETTSKGEVSDLFAEGMGGSSAGFVDIDSPDSTSFISEGNQTITYEGVEAPVYLGRYIPYYGGEAHIDYEITVSGTFWNEGIGLILILDGKPQAYRTDTMEEYSYLHIFYPPTEYGGNINIELIFTPVTGQAGDNLLITSYYICNPYYDPSEAFTFVPGTVGTGGQAQMVFLADAPQGEFPGVTERVIEQTLTLEDMSSADIGGWTASQLQKNASFQYTVSARYGSDMLFGITEDAPLHIHIEVFGPEITQWSLLLYVDNQPVTVLPENEITFSTPSGQKAVIDIYLDMTDYRECARIYAVLTDRNHYEPLALGTTEIVSMVSEMRYMTPEENLIAWMLKYHPDDPYLEHAGVT